MLGSMFRRLLRYHIEDDSICMVYLILTVHDSSNEPVVLVSLDIVVITLEVGRSIGTGLSERHGKFWNKCSLILGAYMPKHTCAIQQ